MTHLHEDLEATLRASAAWRLLRTDHAPLILGFLGQVFVEENVRTIAGSDLTSRLDDLLYVLNEGQTPPRYPRPPAGYLDEWAMPEKGWLRKYYPQGSDEPHFDATPALEKAFGFVRSLRSRAFIGTQSRLNTIVELLRQMAFGAEEDPEVRLAELHRRRDLIDREIAEVKRGNVAMLDDAAQRDRYQQLSAMASELLSDFREVEANFRALDRQLREQIAGWEGSKADLLDEVIGDRNAIAESDQGRSFHAFYDFLLSAERQQEFTDLLGQVQSLPSIEPDPRLRHVHYDWLDAGERTQSTVRLLSEQLRRFLDDQVWLENRRVVEILRAIEQHAIVLREQDLSGLGMTLDASAPTVVLPLERPLHQPRASLTLDSALVADDDRELDATALLDQVFVDTERLSGQVRQLVRQDAVVGLTEVLAAHPLEQGLAEFVAYLSLSDIDLAVVFDESNPQEYQWSDETGRQVVARIPRVTFARPGRVIDALPDDGSTIKDPQ